MSNYNSTTHRKSHFTMIPNELIRDSSISAKAFKLICIGLSHAENWHFSKKQLATNFKEGLYTVDEAVKELREKGYLHLVHKRKNGKMGGWHYHWFDSPITEEEFKKCFRNPENLVDGNSGASEDICDIRRPISKKTKDSKKEQQTKEEPPSACLSGSDKKEDRVKFSNESRDYRFEIEGDHGYKQEITRDQLQIAAMHHCKGLEKREIQKILYLTWDDLKRIEIKPNNLLSYAVGIFKKHILELKKPSCEKNTQKNTSEKSENSENAKKNSCLGKRSKGKFLEIWRSMIKPEDDYSLGPYNPKTCSS